MRNTGFQISNLALLAITCSKSKTLVLDKLNDHSLIVTASFESDLVSFQLISRFVIQQ